jgi:hypothetical protein
MNARQALLERQVADVRLLAPEQVLETPGERGLAILAHLYLAPPMFAETGNYQAETAREEAAYLAYPLNRLWGGQLGAGFLLAATLLGLAWTARTVRCDPAKRRATSLFLLAGFLQTAFLVAAVPLPWQRYSLPLVPFVCLLASGGLVWFISGWTRGDRKSTKG